MVVDGAGCMSMVGHWWVNGGVIGGLWLINPSTTCLQAGLMPGNAGCSTVGCYEPPCVGGISRGVALGSLTWLNV